MKLVRLWGTRGSIPVALTAAGVRAKIEAALKGARGRALKDDAAIAAYLDGLEFHQSATYGGHSSCVQIETPDIFIFFHLKISVTKYIGGHSDVVMGSISCNQKVRILDPISLHSANIY